MILKQTTIQEYQNHERFELIEAYYHYVLKICKCGVRLTMLKMYYACAKGTFQITNCVDGQID